MKETAYRLLFKSLLQGATGLQALTPNEKSFLARLFDETKIEVVGNGIDISKYEKRQTRQNASADGASLGRRRLLYLGRLHPIKGVDRLVDAWSQISPASGWELVIAGSGDKSYENLLRDRAANVGAGTISFVGPVYGQAKIDLIGSSELMVLPSHTEAFPMTILEGLALGVPQAVTDPGYLQVLSESASGFCLGNSVLSIVQGLREAIGTDRSTLIEMGSRGRALVVRDYSWGKIADRLEHFFGFV